MLGTMSLLGHVGDRFRAAALAAGVVLSLGGCGHDDAVSHDDLTAQIMTLGTDCPLADSLEISISVGDRLP